MNTNIIRSKKVSSTAPMMGRTSPAAPPSCSQAVAVSRITCSNAWAFPVQRRNFVRQIWIPFVNNYLQALAKNEGILLANVLQGYSSTFPCASFPSVFAFQEGMWGTLILALLNSPTVTHEPGLSTAYKNSPAIFSRVSEG